MKPAQVFLVLFALFSCIRLIQSANILAIFGYTFSSPFLVVQPYIKSLVSKGHNVTIISAVRFLPDIEGVRHIRVPNLDANIDYILNHDFDMELLLQKWNGAIFAASFHYNITNGIFSDLGVQSLLKDKNEHFDLVVMEPSFSDSLIGFAEHFNALQVGFATFGSSWLVDYYAGNSAPSNYRPMAQIGYSSGDSLMDKWNNWIHISEEWLMDKMVYMPKQLELYRRYFPFSAETFHKRRRNFSLMLINQHFSLGRARSNFPNIIEVAGIHLAEPIQPLQTELQDFLDGAEHGVIYFSMGMEILPKYLPDSMEQKMLQTFSQLKQRIVWKHEADTRLNNSENIYFVKEVSQRQLLEHPNTKLFITHGGLLSVIEAAYSGIPLLGLPLYFDQFDNVERMKHAGVARSMDLNTFTVEQVTENIQKLLENPYYSFKAKELSSRFRDQPTSPLERAVWWTEYILRHKGAPHMRVDEHDMNFLQYYSIQFLLVIGGRILFTAFIIFIAAFILFNCLMREFKRINGTPILYNALNKAS